MVIQMAYNFAIIFLFNSGVVAKGFGQVKNPYPMIITVSADARSIRCPLTALKAVAKLWPMFSERLFRHVHEQRGFIEHDSVGKTMRQPVSKTCAQRDRCFAFDYIDPGCSSWTRSRYASTGHCL